MAKSGLDKAQVEHVAKLASLDISSKDITKAQEELSKMVDYVGKMSNVKVHSPRGDAFMSNQIQSSKNTIKARADKVDSSECLSQDEATSNAKNKHDGLFMVPPIFKE
ncbi:Asp-tRNA(Asn)/Glu-tRNA(Gln) amidotransferase GatCAB subunit C [Candidatus Woesebacteria bacterium]|nr:Asp-tRNA(Asn)/Glu-tRNA(Gln) amidotransferase GatCAB subunit C [Candidatus Woesebacteria bacterium]|tara:strand:- start:61 stop:384 length:324 start_codon:yes stop_codon:yes gene_type:complete